jgi:hypothetical protein
VDLVVFFGVVEQVHGNILRRYCSMMKEGNDPLLWALVMQHAGRCLRQPLSCTVSVGKQEEIREDQSRCEDGAVVVVVALEAEQERGGFLSL